MPRHPFDNLRIWAPIAPLLGLGARYPPRAAHINIKYSNSKSSTRSPFTGRTHKALYLVKPYGFNIKRTLPFERKVPHAWTFTPHFSARVRGIKPSTGITSYQLVSLRSLFESTASATER